MQSSSHAIGSINPMEVVERIVPKNRAGKPKYGEIKTPVTKGRVIENKDINRVLEKFFLTSLKSISNPAKNIK